MKLFDLLRDPSRLKISHKGRTNPLPDWAVAYIWLGALARITSHPGCRAIFYVVVPNRDLAAAFSALGALLAGASVHTNSPSWGRFKQLPKDTNVYWKERQGEKNFEGKILGYSSFEGTEFINVKVTRPASQARNGLEKSVSEMYFDRCSFTLDKPLQTHKHGKFKIAGSWYNNLIENPYDDWAVSYTHLTLPTKRIV